MVCKKHYDGQIRKGLFFQTTDPIRSKKRTLLKEGTITLGNGDIWEGVFKNWRWFEGEKDGDKHCTFVLQGTVSFAGSGEQKKGVFLCEDNRANFRVEKQLE